MTYKEFQKKVADQACVSYTDTDKVLRALSEVIYKNNEKGEVFKFPFLGTLRINTYDLSKNPFKKKIKSKKERLVVRFKPYLSFKQKINA